MTRDKVLHLIAGAVIALAVGSFLTPLAGLIAACLAGIGKEVWDHQGNGTVDPLDAIATALGGFLMYGGLSWIV